MKITIRRNDYDRIVEYALKERPNEACGLIAGTDRDDGIREIKKVYLLTNIDHTNEHFSIDPKEQLKSIKDMRANGLSLLATGIRIPRAPHGRRRRTSALQTTAAQATSSSRLKMRMSRF